MQFCGVFKVCSREGCGEDEKQENALGRESQIPCAEIRRVYGDDCTASNEL